MQYINHYLNHQNIQIQHLLKLNDLIEYIYIKINMDSNTTLVKVKCRTGVNGTSCPTEIQIQHLLKLNCTTSSISFIKLYSNTTLVKVK